MGYSDSGGEGGGGVRSTPLVFSRDGSLLPSGYADARYVDAVIVSKARATTGCTTMRSASTTAKGQAARVTAA